MGNLNYKKITNKGKSLNLEKKLFVLHVKIVKWRLNCFCTLQPASSEKFQLRNLYYLISYAFLRCRFAYSRAFEKLVKFRVFREFVTEFVHAFQVTKWHKIRVLLPVKIRSKMNLKWTSNRHITERMWLNVDFVRMIYNGKMKFETTS